MAAVKATLSEDAIAHLTVVAAQRGHSLSTEIRERLELSISLDRSDVSAAEMISDLINLLLEVRAATGERIWRHPVAYQTYCLAVQEILQTWKPEKPVSNPSLDNDDPATLARSIVRRYLQSKSTIAASKKGDSK